MDIKNEERPWGSFRQFTLNEISTVKILFVSAGQEDSLQTHTNREEFWRVLSGNPTLIIGNKERSAKPGDECMIPKHTQHRIKASDTDVQVLEISLGNFDETDEVRLADDYGRVAS